MSLLVLITGPATMAAADTVVRATLYGLSRRRRLAQPDPAPRIWLVVLPARAEASRLLPTLDSLAAAAEGHPVRNLLLLDGADPEAERIARAKGFEVVVKHPAGPTKAAALAWLARERPLVLLGTDAVLVIDAGSRLDAQFFDRFSWPAGAGVVQVPIAACGEGVGTAVAASERFAQEHEDRGRERAGWNVRIRGTGTCYRADVFLGLMPRLVTRAEDHEATLLLTAAGVAVRMGSDEAVVYDEKPSSISSASSQRARWLLGRYELLVRRFGIVCLVVMRHPLEGLAFLVETFGRPLLLSVPLRLLAAALLFAHGGTVWAGMLTASSLLDAGMQLPAFLAAPRSIMRLGLSWLLAAVLAPRALIHWMRADH
jgi:cellulose synthase/poly-beta-1,6-N-acetylglucosamine synthase-like glycosyltransferase